MGIRVTLPSVTPPMGQSGSPVADTYLGALRPLQGSVDAYSGLGGTTQTTLQAASAEVDNMSRSPLSGVEGSLQLNTNALNSNLGQAVSFTPPRVGGRVSGLAGASSRMTAGYTGAFRTAKAAVTGTNGTIALALMAACLVIAACLQGGVSRLMASALRMQRTMLAKLDSVRKQAVELVQRSIDAAMEALPDCPQSVKDVIQELRSVLGKTSTMVAAVNKVLREVAACAAIGAAGAALITGNSAESPGTITRVTRNSRKLAKYDATQMKRDMGRATEESKDTIAKNRGSYAEGEYLNEEITGKLENARKEAERMREEVNDLIADSKEAGSGTNPDDPRYLEALERAKDLLDKIIEDLKNAESNLRNETVAAIDKMTDTATDALDKLKENLEGETDAISASVDEIFGGLEKIAEEFETPEVQEHLATACAETQYRTVLDQNS